MSLVGTGAFAGWEHTGQQRCQAQKREETHDVGHGCENDRGRGRGVVAQLGQHDRNGRAGYGREYHETPNMAHNMTRASPKFWLQTKTPIAVTAAMASPLQKPTASLLGEDAGRVRGADLAQRESPHSHGEGLRAGIARLTRDYG